MTTIPGKQYKVVHDVLDHDLEKILNREASEGWTLDQIVRGAGSWSLIMVQKIALVIDTKETP